MEIVVQHWFSGGTGTVGIVVGRDNVTKEHHAYIGVASGLDENEDTKSIMEYGAKIKLSRLEEIVRLMKRGQNVTSPEKE